MESSEGLDTVDSSHRHSSLWLRCDSSISDLLLTQLWFMGCVWMRRLCAVEYGWAPLKLACEWSVHRVWGRRGEVSITLFRALPCLCRTAYVHGRELALTAQLLGFSHKVFSTALSCWVCARMQTRGNASGCVGGKRESSSAGFCRRSLFNVCCCAQILEI